MGVDVGQADAICFSFYIAHLLITGVGGMTITNDKKLADLIRSLIFHGRDNRYLKIDDDDKYSEEVIHSRFRFNYPGYSYRGTEVEGALGLIELELLEENIKRRQFNAYYLNSKLGMWDFAYLENHAFMMFPLLSFRRDELMLYLEKKGITTRTIMPLINQPYIKARGYPRSEYILKHGLLIPSHQSLSKADLKYIVKTIREFHG